MRSATFTTLLLGAALRVAAQNADPANVASIIAAVGAIPNQASQFNTFAGREYVFDFNEGVGLTGGAGGNITVANVLDFPFLFGKGMALSVGRLAPCGMASPHYHPRSSEFLYMLTGSSLRVGFLLENGARLVQEVLYPGQGFVFPKNSFHYQQNLGCESATFVAGFNHEDPGVGTVGQRFFGLPPNVTDVSLGDIGVDESVRIAEGIPDTFAIGVQSCLDTCGLQRTEQQKTQLQPRVVGNGFPSGTPARREVDNNLNKRSEVPVQPVTSSTPMTSLFSAANVQSLNELVFLLKIVVGVLLSGYVFTWVYFVIPTWRNRKLQAELQARAAAAALAAPYQDVKV